MRYFLMHGLGVDIMHMINSCQNPGWDNGHKIYATWYNNMGTLKQENGSGMYHSN